MITSIVWSQTKIPHWSEWKAKQETNKMCSNKILPSFIISDSLSALPKVNSSSSENGFHCFPKEETERKKKKDKHNHHHMLSTHNF